MVPYLHIVEVSRIDSRVSFEFLQAVLSEAVKSMLWLKWQFQMLISTTRQNVLKL